METSEMAKPAHHDGGGPREFEQLGGRLDIRNSTLDSASQTRAAVSIFDHRAQRADTASDTIEHSAAPPAPMSPRASYAPRLNANSRVKVTIGNCRWCGKEFEARKSTKEFCCNSCRQKFHNLNMRRGAEIISLAMHLRFDRDHAKECGSYTLYCRLLRKFKDQDELVGRGSWDDLAEVFDRNRHLGFGTVLDRNVLGLRRTGRRK